MLKQKYALISCLLLLAAPILVILQSVPAVHVLNFNGIQNRFHEAFMLRENINTLTDNALTYDNVAGLLDFYFANNLIERDRVYFETIMIYSVENYVNAFSMMTLGRLYESKKENALYWYKKAMENASKLTPAQIEYCEARIKHLTAK